MKYLWAILIPGPDDVWAMPDNESANEAARKHNQFVDSEKFPYPELRDGCYARVIVWPHGKREHATSAEEWRKAVSERSTRADGNGESGQ